MSRQTYPTQLRDHLGNEFRLSTKPFATGGEGAVFDVVDRHDLVAKLYSKPQSDERCDKLRAMAKLCSPELHKIAAWPISTLHEGNLAAVEGFLMPRIADHKEIHHLYSVAQRKKDFPEADWGFLLHTARNCAIAFESIHRHGHVVGDVNQKNVMVSKLGIVALVDCDSFQVKEGNRIFRCGVGVAEYTPPELKGRKFTDLDRDANHDLFGLAVMVFHLLIMGRHPFAGVPQNNVDIPIEKAIQGGLYAYARNPTKLKPPPNVPPMAMLDTPILDLFERAFGSAQRPTATEWRRVLDASMKGLQRCKNDPKHIYPAAAGNCPWCHLIVVARLMFFIPGQQAAGAMARIERIRILIRKLTGMSLAFASYTRPAPILPVEVILPAGLRTSRMPLSQQNPAPPVLLPKPELLPSPLQPVLLARPKLRPHPIAPFELAGAMAAISGLAAKLLPRPPAPVEPPRPKLQPKPIAPVELPRPKLQTQPIPPVELPRPKLQTQPIPPVEPPRPKLRPKPIAPVELPRPKLRPKPIAPVELPRPKLQTIPPPPIYPKVLTPDPLHPFLPGLCITGILGGVPMCLVALPVGVIMMLGFGAWLLIMIATEGMWHRMAQESLKKEHEEECTQIQEVYDEEVQSIRKAKWKLLDAWGTANAKKAAEHTRRCKATSDENSRILTLWEAEKKEIQAAHGRAIQKIEDENRPIITLWEAEKAEIQAAHGRAIQKIDEENHCIITPWETEKAEIQAAHRRAIQKVEDENRRIITLWETEKAEIQAGHGRAIQKIDDENRRLITLWGAEKAEIEANHGRAIQKIDDENRRLITLWEAEKAEIEATHGRAIQKIDDENRRLLSTWEVENVARHAIYDQARRKSELQNFQRISEWKALTASRQAEYDQKCREIEEQDRLALASWKSANAPWIEKQNQWRSCATKAEAEIKRLEQEFEPRRNASDSKFQGRKLKAEGVLKSFEGVRQDFEQELRRAEDNSLKIQLEEYLDKSLIRSAKLNGFNNYRLIALESFGIETAKDISILENGKVPGIGPVLRDRLIEWRDKLASLFRPQKGLPESEKNRVAAPYTPVLMPQEQAIQAAINDLQGIAVAHQNQEADLIKAIKEAVQDLAKAEAYVRKMKLV